MPLLSEGLGVLDCIGDGLFVEEGEAVGVAEAMGVDDGVGVGADGTPVDTMLRR